jgi:hypothetical protein
MPKTVPLLNNREHCYEGDRTSDIELQKLAQRQVKPNSQAWEEGELVDIRLAEDLKRRRQERRSR